jgi:hypothetical protein
MRSRNSAGSAPSGVSLRNVRLGSAFESTARARSVSPLSSTTPVAAPPSTSTSATGAEVRISTPRSRAAAASDCVTPPMPPRT